jgi:hypothetical protein
MPESGSIQRSGLSPQRLRRLHRALQGYVQRGEIAGIVVLIHRHGQEAHVETLGWQDRETQIPIQHDTLFRIMSMTIIESHPRHTQGIRGSPNNVRRVCAPERGRVPWRDGTVLREGAVHTGNMARHAHRECRASHQWRAMVGSLNLSLPTSYETRKDL